MYFAYLNSFAPPTYSKMDSNCIIIKKQDSKMYLMYKKTPVLFPTFVVIVDDIKSWKIDSI